MPASLRADRHRARFLRRGHCWQPSIITPCFLFRRCAEQSDEAIQYPTGWIASLSLAVTKCSNPVENNDRRRTRQRLSRNPQGTLGPDVDLELLADPAHEFVERGHEAMHRQHHG